MKTGKPILDALIDASESLAAPQFPTVQEQINYWNERERLELERVSRIQEAESRDATNETGEWLKENGYWIWVNARRKRDLEILDNAPLDQPLNDEEEAALQRERDREQIDASNPQEQASTTAKTLTEEEERREDCARWFDDKEQAEYLDERDARWDAARNL